MYIHAGASACSRVTLNALPCVRLCTGTRCNPYQIARRACARRCTRPSTHVAARITRMSRNLVLVLFDFILLPLLRQEKPFSPLSPFVLAASAFSLSFSTPECPYPFLASSPTPLNDRPPISFLFPSRQTCSRGEDCAISL